jgi:hypothetical protein
MKPRSFDLAGATWTGLGVLFLLAMAGCGGPSYQFGEVQGKVTYQKKPLIGVLVRFYPVSDGKAQLPIASAITDEAGTYVLNHQQDKPGALAGPNRVVVQWPARDLRAAANKSGKPLPPPTPPIPTRYTILEDTPFTFEVAAGGAQTIDIDLVP